MQSIGPEFELAEMSGGRNTEPFALATPVSPAELLAR
jgi:hypothetical protein